MTFFGQYAYQPGMVYSFIILFMLASSFGFPVPEELVLVSTGLIAYMATHPAKFPPPYEGAEGINVVTACIVSFLAVFCSDMLVYLIGKFFGGRIIKTKFFQKSVAGSGFDKINAFFQKYGGWAVGVFRFTPGLRFPGHLSCGLLGIPVWKFILIDTLAAGFSVPTQVYFVAKYGEVILEKLSTFKMYLGIAILIFGVIWLGKKVYQKNVRKIS